METKIKQVGIEHDDIIEQIVAMSHRFSFESHIYEGLKFNQDKFRQHVRNHTQAPTGIYAAMCGETVTGYAAFMIDQHYIDEKNFEILTIYVPSEYRKTDSARALAKALIDTMDINGCKYGQVSICCAMKENEDLINMLTQNLFKKLGFYQIGIIMGRKGKTWEQAS